MAQPCESTPPQDTCPTFSVPLPENCRSLLPALRALQRLPDSLHAQLDQKTFDRLYFSSRSYSLRDALQAVRSTNLLLPTSLPAVECYIADVCAFAVANAAILPPLKVDDFYVHDQTTEVPFGCVRYAFHFMSPVVFRLLDPTAIPDGPFRAHHTWCANSRLTPANLAELVKEMLKTAGPLGFYDRSGPAFVRRLREMQAMDEVAADRYYRHCVKRRRSRELAPESLFVRVPGDGVALSDLRVDADGTLWNGRVRVKPLAEGGTGVIYRAQYATRHTRREVVLKGRSAAVDTQ